MNCKNCGAASFSEGRCDYCWSPGPAERDRFTSDITVIAEAYYRGLIGTTEYADAIRHLNLGLPTLLPAGAKVDLERVRV